MSKHPTFDKVISRIAKERTDEVLDWLADKVVLNKRSGTLVLSGPQQSGKSTFHTMLKQLGIQFDLVVSEDGGRDRKNPDIICTNATQDGGLVLECDPILLSDHTTAQDLAGKCKQECPEFLRTLVDRVC